MWMMCNVVSAAAVVARNPDAMTVDSFNFDDISNSVVGVT